MSRYYRSRLDIGRGGERFVCEDLRAGCPGLLADDGAGKDYDYLSLVTTPDAAAAAGGGSSGAPSCVAAAAVRGAAARPRGRGVRFTVRPRTTVEVFRQTLRGRITRQRLVARFPRRSRAFTWDGRATLRGRRVPAGAVYSARFRGSGGAVKHVTLARRAGGRFARRGTFRTIAGCGTIRDATLARPVFGGRGGKPLDIRFRLNTPARVEVDGRAAASARSAASRPATAPPAARSACDFPHAGAHEAPTASRSRARPVGRAAADRAFGRNPHLIARRTAACTEEGRSAARFARRRVANSRYRDSPLDAEWHLSRAYRGLDATRATGNATPHPYEQSRYGAPRHHQRPRRLPSTGGAAYGPAACTPSRRSKASRSRRSPTTTRPGCPARRRPAPWATVLDAVVWFHRAAPGAAERLPAALRGRRSLPVTVGALIRYRETPVGPYHEVLASPVAARRPARARRRSCRSSRSTRCLGPRRARELGAAEDARALRLAGGAARRLRARRGGRRLVGPRDGPPARRGGCRSRRPRATARSRPTGTEITFDSAWRGRARLASVELETRGPTLPGWLRSGRHPALVLEGARVRVGAARPG